MKKGLLLLSLASVCIVFNVQAQIKKGAVLLGGDIGASNLKSTIQDSVTNKQRNINVGFSYGKAIRENLILGGSVYWKNQRITNWASQDLVQNVNTWGLGVFMRKYKQLGTSGFYVFAQGALSGEYMRQKMSSPGDEGITNGWSAMLAAYPGISYAISKKLQIETGLSNFLQLSYSESKAKADLPSFAGSKSSVFNFSTSIDDLSSLYLGFRILLN